MPHLLIVERTGTGQMTFIDTFILSLIYRVSPGKIRVGVSDIAGEPAVSSFCII